MEHVRALVAQHQTKFRYCACFRVNRCDHGREGALGGREVILRGELSQYCYTGIKNGISLRYHYNACKRSSLPDHTTLRSAVMGIEYE